MIDTFSDKGIYRDVKRICRWKYKKGLFDFSGRWKEEVKRVWSMSYRDMRLWIESNDPERSEIHCQGCDKDYIYIACPYFCIKCHELRERNGKHIEQYVNTK